MDNSTIAKKLSDYANQLERDHSGLYRVRAYRRAAETILALAEPLHNVLNRSGRNGLRALPGIGDHLAFTLEELLRTGKFRTWREAHSESEDVIAEPVPDEPTVEELLSVDAEYREQARSNRLFTIRPIENNPEGARWLPVFRTTRGEWRVRALFSNTALAHRLNKTHDWVVLYFTDGTHTGQRTVITEKYGDLIGQRVVRGREAECRALYRTPEPAA